MGAKVVGQINILTMVNEQNRIPHVTKDVFVQHGIRFEHIADLIDVNSHTVRHVLSGSIYPSQELDFNLKCLAAFLLQYGKTGPFEDMGIDNMT